MSGVQLAEAEERCAAAAAEAERASRELAADKAEAEAAAAGHAQAQAAAAEKAARLARIEGARTHMADCMCSGLQGFHSDRCTCCGCRNGGVSGDTVPCNQRS